MSILSKTIKAIKATGSGVATVSSGLMGVGKRIANTSKRLAYGITGGPREQTYGYFAELFENDKKYSEKKAPAKVTPIKEVRKQSLTMPQYGDSTEALNNIFDFMKRSQEKQIRQLEVQRSFDEERMSEEDRRHRELLEAIKKFVDVKVTATASRVEEAPKTTLMDDILSGIKSMVEGIVKNAILAIEKTIEGIKTTLTTLKEAYDVLKPLGGQLLQNILRFAMSPIFGAMLATGTVALFLKHVADEKAAIEANPYDAKYKDNAYAKVRRGEVETVAQGAEANIRQTRKSFSRPEIEDAVKSDLPDSVLVDAYGMDKQNLKKWLAENPKAMKYQAPVAPIVGLPKTAVRAGGNPMPQRPEAQIPPEVPATPTATPTPPVPVSAPVSQVTNTNKELEDNVFIATAKSNPIVMKNGSSDVKSEPPIPATATQRDEEPMASTVFKNQRQNARAY